MIAAEQAAAAWRRRCPDITAAEIAALAALRLQGNLCQVALRAYRAGLATGKRDARARAA